MLGEREQVVLKEVVDSYVAGATPVGSRTVADRIDLGLSPATIRHTMMELEEKGFLNQPHASAGRIPTDKGYRAYVDELMAPAALSPEEEDWIGEQLETGPGELVGFLSQAARLLGGACMELGLVLAPSLDRGILTGLEIARLSGSRVMIMLRIRNGLVRTVLLDVKTGLDPATLARTASRLNEALVGLTLGEIRRSLSERLESPAFRDDEIVARLLHYGPSLFRFAGDSVLYVAGTGNIVAQPEFRSPEALESLMGLIEERSHLSSLLEDRRSRSGVHITIGKENPAGPLEATSIITMRYAHGDLCGTLGVMGPTRMKYQRVVGVLQRVAGHFHARLTA